MGDKSEVSLSTACEKVNGVGTDKNLFRLVPPSTTCTSGARARAQALSLGMGTKSEKGYHFWAEPPCIVHYRECPPPPPPPPGFVHTEDECKKGLFMYQLLFFISLSSVKMGWQLPILLTTVFLHFTLHSKHWRQGGVWKCSSVVCIILACWKIKKK